MGGKETAYRKEVLGVLLFAFGFFTTLSLFSYSAVDPGFHAVSNAETIHNLGGVVGAYLADLLLTTFGLSAYVLSLLPFLLAILKFRGASIGIRLSEALYYFLFLISVSALLQIHFPTATLSSQTFAGGGLVGAFLGESLVHYLNRVGAQILVITFCLLFFILATHLKVSHVLVNAGKLLRFFALKLGQWGRVTFQRSKTGALYTAAWLAGQFRSMFGQVDDDDEEFEEEEEEEIEWEEEPDEEDDFDDEEEDEEEELEEDEEFDEEEEEDEEEESEEENLKINTRKDLGKKPSGEQLQFLKISGNAYNPPPLSLLDSEQQKPNEVDPESLKKNALLLVKKLRDYGVEGKVTEIHPGPVITMYEFEPKAGTKVNKIVSLESDLSLTMGGRSIRIVPHLPGKAALGIEIPNGERETVWLKEIISSKNFSQTKSKLVLALGKDIEGYPKIADLAKMPHLLIAGATGAGKSVGINSMLISLLYKASPSEVRLILVDPKRLELNIYEGIPHLLLPVVTEPKKALAALKWSLREMDRRYRLLADVGTRNVQSYNEKIDRNQVPVISLEKAEQKLADDKEAICHTGKLYQLVIMIDELADLMMVSSQELEETITRLAQMARAAGIHLILATQRPSVDVITGLIKANFPTRISFKVSARHDSRTILDQIGAETLLGNGDMLFIPPGASGVERVHGAYVTESEIARVVTHLKQQGTPEYDTSILETAIEESEAAEDLDAEESEIYDKAIRLVSQTRQASISMIQRRLRIGYNRAARMVERMEQEGVVGPQDGAKPRQVLIGSIDEA